jgi:enamine deaminase RidA (YjgF/YER057c/UK114 family)
MQRRCFNRPGPQFPALSEVVEADGWVWVSGQVSVVDGALVGRGDPQAQARQCFENLKSALALAGAGFADVMRLNCYVTDAKAYPAYAAEKAKHFGENPPAGTAVVVAGLLVEGAFFEVEAVAARSAP